jgi:hypothetical protein
MTGPVLTHGLQVEDIEVFADDLDPQRASEVYRTHGCLVVRGLHRRYVADVAEDVERVVAHAKSLLDQAEAYPGGWRTPDGAVWLPAPAGYGRDQQIMTVPITYRNSAAFFRMACDERTADLMQALIGPDVELFGDGQCLYKEPVGGHPKKLHQDAAYFTHRFDGPIAALTYLVDTDLVNGALHVVPGSHQLGTLAHVDTFSHLGLDDREWPWETALPITGDAGDVILFHYRTVHGSQENHSQHARPVAINRYRDPRDYVCAVAVTAEQMEKARASAHEAVPDGQEGFMLGGFRPFGG